MPDVDGELRKFFASYQPNKVALNSDIIQTLLTEWGVNLGLAGSDGFWENLKERWSKFDESSYKIGKNKVEEFLTHAGVDKETKASVMGIYGSLSAGDGFMGFITQLTTAVGALYALKPIYNSLLIRIDQSVKARIPTELPDLGTLIDGDWREYSPKKLSEYWGKLGYSTEIRNLITQTKQPLLSLGEISRIRQINNWKHDETVKRLKWLGYSDYSAGEPRHATVAEINTLLRPPVPISDCLEIERRGKFDESGFVGQMRHLGMDSEMQRWYEALKVTLPDAAMLHETRRRGILTEPEFFKGLENLGYDSEGKDLHKSLLEQLPDFFTLRNLYWRDVITEPTFKAQMEQLGYTNDFASKIVENSDVLPTPQDLVRFGVKEIFDKVIRKKYGMDDHFPNDIKPWAKKIGMSEEVMKMFWASHWDLPSPGQGYDMLHRGLINDSDLQQLLRALDVMPGWIPHMMALSYKLIPRRALPKLVRQNLISFDDLQLRFKALGFNITDATTMAKSAMKDAEEPEKEATKGEVIDDYVYEGSSLAKLEQRLKVLGYDDSTIGLLVAKAKRKKAKYEASLIDVDTIKAGPKAKELTKSEIIKMFKQSVITEERAISLLSAIDVSPSTISYIITFAKLELARETREDKAKQYKRLFDAKVDSVTVTQAKLNSAGYSDNGSTSLVSAWTLERNTDDLLSQAKLKNPSKADLNDWLKKGVIEVETWREGMLNLGYSTDITAYYLMELAIDLQKAD